MVEEDTRQQITKCEKHKFDKPVLGHMISVLLTLIHYELRILLLGV